MKYVFRIVRDTFLYSGFEVQWRPVWWPFFFKRMNNHYTIEDAEDYAHEKAAHLSAKDQRGQVVKNLGVLP